MDVKTLTGYTGHLLGLDNEGGVTPPERRIFEAFDSPWSFFKRAAPIVAAPVIFAGCSVIVAAHFLWHFVDALLNLAVFQDVLAATKSGTKCAEHFKSTLFLLAATVLSPFIETFHVGGSIISNVYQACESFTAPQSSL